MGHDELPPEWEEQVQLMDAATGWMPIDFKRWREAKSLGFPSADYWAVYAVEREQVLSAVRVIRLPYTMSDGSVEIVSGIAGVVTRRESSRRGLAKQLLEEVHRREAEAGSKLSILQTGFSNIAHNLYVSVGYVDVFTARLAMKRLASSGKKERSTEFKIRPVRAGDAETMERIHSEATKGRVGFTPRPKGYLRALFKLGLVEPGSFRLVQHGKEPVAYYRIKKGSGWVDSDEVVMKPGIKLESILSALEWEGRNGWLVLYGTFVNDSAALLKERRYLFTDNSYSGFLARPLVDVEHRNVRKAMGVDKDSFTCQYIDYF